MVIPFVMNSLQQYVNDYFIFIFLLILNQIILKDLTQ